MINKNKLNNLSKYFFIRNEDLSNINNSDEDLSNIIISNYYIYNHRVNLNNLSNFYLDGKKKNNLDTQLSNIVTVNTNIKQNNKNYKIVYDFYENQSYLPKPNLNMINIHKIYIIVSNCVLNEGYTFKKVLQSYNIQCEVINLNNEKISDELYREILNNNDRIIIAIGVINIINAKLLHNLKEKCLVYQIEQKNILYDNENYIMKLFLKDMTNILEFSHNNTYYDKDINVLIPFIEEQTNSNLKDIDILFYGSLSERRKNILNNLFNLNKYKIKYIHNSFGKELLNLISRSKIVLNLHYKHNSFFETFRINLAIAYNTHIISENPTNINEKYLYNLYKNLVYFVPEINNTNYYNLDKVISKLLKTPVVKTQKQLNEIERINNISKQILFENLNIMNSINNLRKSNLDETLFHKYYLKLETTDNQIKYNVIKTNISDYFIEKKYYAHLHCYDISKFNEIYGEYIDTICRYFSVIVTYSIGNNTIDKNSVLVILKIPNKGMDIGGKFCAVAYLDDNKIQYNYILFLHSKSNPETRRKYFKPLIDNLDDKFIKNINENDGYFPDIQWEIVGDRLKWVSNNPDFKNHENTNWPERNLLYRNEIIKYLGANNNTNNFIEGNCYILSKKVIDKLYTSTFIYNILNSERSFDYNWVSKAYNIQGDIYEVYKQFKERKLEPRNEKSFDGYLEHVFERVVLNFCNNYKILNIKKKIFIKKKICNIYTVTESQNLKQDLIEIIFFIKKGAIIVDNIYNIIIINGKYNLNIPESKNIIILEQEYCEYEFMLYKLGIEYFENKYNKNFADIFDYSFILGNINIDNPICEYIKDTNWLEEIYNIIYYNINSDKINIKKHNNIENLYYVF